MVNVHLVVLKGYLFLGEKNYVVYLSCDRHCAMCFTLQFHLNLQQNSSVSFTIPIYK